MISPIFVIKVVFSILLLLRLTDKIISSAFFLLSYLQTTSVLKTNCCFFIIRNTKDNKKLKMPSNKQTDKQNAKKKTASYLIRGTVFLGNF